MPDALSTLRSCVDRRQLRLQAVGVDGDFVCSGRSRAPGMCPAMKSSSLLPTAITMVAGSFSDGGEFGGRNEKSRRRRGQDGKSGEYCRHPTRAFPLSCRMSTGAPILAVTNGGAGPGRRSLRRVRPHDVDGERDTARQGQLAVDRGEVALDGLGADAELRGDLLVAQSARDGLGNLLLPRVSDSTKIRFDTWVIMAASASQ